MVALADSTMVMMMMILMTKRVFGLFFSGKKNDAELDGPVLAGALCVCY